MHSLNLLQHFFQSIDPLYALSGAVVGALVGFTGVGGGALMTPLLILVFGISPSSAVGTDLIYAATTKTAGSLVHGRLRAIQWRVVGLLALGSVPCSALTTLALLKFGIDRHSTQHLMTTVLGVALLGTAISLILRGALLKVTAQFSRERNPAMVRRLTILTGAVLGVLVTLSSVGAGAIGVTALVLLYPELETRRIVGTDVAHAVPLTLTAGIGHSILGTINLHILSSLLVGSLPCIVVASLLANKVPEFVLRVALASVLLLVCARFWFLN